MKDQTETVNWIPNQNKANIENMDAWFENLEHPMMTVVIGAYNQRHVLPLVMEGWEKQTYVDGYEIFLCDDHSNDGTKEWAEEYAKKPHKFKFTYLRVVKREEPGGLARNLNQALPLTTGHYTFFCMGDTIPQEDTLAQLGKHVAGGRVLCGVRKNISSKMEFESWDWRMTNPDVFLTKDLISIKDDCPWAAITGNGLCVPTWALRQVKGWNEAYHGWESDDYDLALRLYEEGLEFFHTPKVIIQHITHPTQPRSLKNVEIFKKAIYDYKNRVRNNTTSITLDFDDFYPSNNGMFYLKELKNHFPKMKVSMFTVPFKKVDENTVESWTTCPDLVKEVNECDWIEILPHGFFHVLHEFDMVTYDQTMLAIKAWEQLFLRLGFRFQRVFRAPHWQINFEALRAFRDAGYAVAINPEDEPKMKIPEGLRCYRHNWGIQFPIPRKTEIKGHGHVQNWNGTGLAENFNNLLDLSTEAEWKFVSEMVPIRENINTSDYWDKKYQGTDLGHSVEGEPMVIADQKYQLIAQAVPNNSKILDLGCGDGILIKYLDKSNRVTGVDFSPEAIELAKKLYPDSQFVCGNLLKPLGVAEDFELVVGCEVWEHLDEPRVLVQQALNHLKSGGEFIFTLPYGNIQREKEHVKEYYLDDVEKILAEFKDIKRFEVLHPNNGLFIFVKGFKK